MRFRIEENNNKLIAYKYNYDDKAKQNIGLPNIMRINSGAITDIWIFLCLRARMHSGKGSDAD